MKCPYCEREMEYKDNGYWGFSFTTGDKPDYPSWICENIYTCKFCNIRNINDEWEIPKKYNRPTEKQEKTVLYINNHLGYNFKPLLRVQCWRIINKYLQKAIKCKEIHDIQMAEDMREWYGEWDYF